VKAGKDLRLSWRLRPQVLTKTLCSFAGEEADAGIELAVLDCKTVRRTSWGSISTGARRTHR